MNTNMLHNILNVLMTVIASLAVFDWTSLGVTQGLALKIIASLGLLKLVINAIRDGVSGMVKDQPPVK